MSLLLLFHPRTRIGGTIISFLPTEVKRKKKRKPKQETTERLAQAQEQLAKALEVSPRQVEQVVALNAEPAQPSALDVSRVVSALQAVAAEPVERQLVRRHVQRLLALERLRIQAEEEEVFEIYAALRLLGI